MRILFITRGSLVGSNNTGNTIINLFSGIEGMKFYNLYLRSESPNTDLCKISYQVSEISIIKNIFGKGEVGKKSYQITYEEYASIYEEDAIEDAINERDLYLNAKRFNSRILWIIREWLWNLGTWENENLTQFIEEVSPDLIIMPAYGCCYPYKILEFIHFNYPTVPIFLYHIDDNYSLKQFSLSMSYWIYRFMLRRYISRAVQFASMNYVISEIQRIEYEKAFKRSCSILTKGSDYANNKKSCKEIGDNISLVYTGNIGDGRFDILVMIGKALDNIGMGELLVYSPNPLTNRMKKQIKGLHRMKFMGAIKPDYVKEVQQHADILVHVESTKLKNRLAVRHSISTKVFDYLNIPRCILAIGPSGVASIEFLRSNDAALVITNLKEIERVLNELVCNKALIAEYAEKAWQTGKKNFDIHKIQQMLKSDMERFLEKNENASDKCCQWDYM
jgi:hypothetical protein